MRRDFRTDRRSHAARRVRRGAATTAAPQALPRPRVHQDHGVPAHLDRRGRRARSARSAVTTASVWIRPRMRPGSPVAGSARYDAVVFLSTTGTPIAKPAQRRAFERYIRAGRRLRRHPRRVGHARQVAVVRATGRRALQAPRARHAEQDRDRRGPHLGGHAHAARSSGHAPTSGTSSAPIHARACTCWRASTDVRWRGVSATTEAASVYTAMGHTEASFSEPQYLAHLLGAIEMAAGRARFDCAP